METSTSKWTVGSFLRVGARGGRGDLTDSAWRHSREQRRVLAGLAQFVGVGYPAYGLIYAEDIWATRALGSLIPFIVGALIFGPGLLLAAASVLPDGARAVPALSVLCLVGFLAGCGVLLIRINQVAQPPVPDWLIVVGSLSALALSQWRSIGASLAALVVCEAVAAYVIGQASDGSLFSMFVDAIFVTLFVAVFVVVTQIVVAAGEAIDRTAAEASRVATESARRAESARVNALIHDRVLATLLVAEAGPTPPVVAAQARAALDHLAGLEDLAVAEDLTGDELLIRLRTSVSSADADAPLRVDDAADVNPATLRYPVEVSEAMCEALGEAVRNSVRHAGPSAERLVQVRRGPGSLGLSVVDDGRGFDPSAIPEGRLGVRHSIRRRVELLPGGQVDILSVPGQGTAVNLEWVAP
jgi:signal transduction histidine kinase